MACAYLKGRLGFRGQVPGQVRKASSLSGKGPRRAAALLQLPSRALVSHKSLQCNRVDFLDSSTQNKEVERAFSKLSAMSITYQLVLEAEKSWRKIGDVERLAEIIRGVSFTE